MLACDCRVTVAATGSVGGEKGRTLGKRKRPRGGQGVRNKKVRLGNAPCKGKKNQRGQRESLRLKRDDARGEQNRVVPALLESEPITGHIWFKPQWDLVLERPKGSNTVTGKDTRPVPAQHRQAGLGRGPGTKQIRDGKAGEIEMAPRFRQTKISSLRMGNRENNGTGHEKEGDQAKRGRIKPPSYGGGSGRKKPTSACGNDM